jgi:hypothetical protein
MLTVMLIDRLFTQERFSSLLRELSRNHLPLPLSVHMKLEDAPSGVVALGLRRVIDLSFMPNVTSRAMLTYILDHQSALGDFHQCPIATAACAGVFGRWTREYPAGNTVQNHPTAQTLAHARQTALEALGTMRHEADGLFAHPADRTVQDRQITSALVLLLLGNDQEAWGLLRAWEVQSALHDMTLDPDAQLLLNLVEAGTGATQDQPRQAA